MARVSVVAGVLFIVGSVGILLASIFATESALVSGIIESVACTPNETLRVERTRWSLPNGESGENITFFCDIEPELGRDVSDTAILLSSGTFTVILLIGIILVIIGTRQLQKRQMQNLDNTMANYFADGGDGVARIVTVQGDVQHLSPETHDMIETILGGVVTKMSGMRDTSLVERLEEIEQAYQKNLISKAEYDQVRQAILDSMDD